MKIKYLVCHDTEINKNQERAYSPAAAAVVRSLSKSLKSIGHDVELISFSSTSGDKNVPAIRYLAEDGITVQLFRSFGRNSFAKRVLNHVYMKIQYTMYLIRNIKKDDVVIAYHSPYHVNILRFLKRFKSFYLVLQMLEIYADVNGDENLREKELKLTNEADAFVFATDILNQTVNIQKKPAAVMLGTYQTEFDRDVRFEDGKIHVLYAGTLDPRKGGAAAAAAAAAFLPDCYRVHILGFGSEADKAELMRTIAQCAKPGCASVTYDGLLSGEEYIRFIQACQIGLSTQMPDAQFNATSFPSKILAYMANGLRVVSVRIPAVESSAIGEYMYYYDQQDPEAIAKAIMQVDLSDGYDGRKIIAGLARGFAREIKVLLEG